MSTTGGKANLMVLMDILDLARSPDYSAHPRQQPNELQGFTVPSFMVAKMRRFVTVMRTPRSLGDAELLAHGEAQWAQWERERRGLLGGGAAEGSDEKPTVMPATEAVAYQQQEVKLEEDDEQKKKQVQEILEEIKTETAAVEQVEREECGGAAADEELGFLNGMNLTSLVREFELQAEAGSKSRLNILSLADDDEDGSGPAGVVGCDDPGADEGATAHAAVFPGLHQEGEPVVNEEGVVLTDTDVAAAETVKELQSEQARNNINPTS